MCPLRVILIFLSATLAGFFLLRNLQSKPDLNADDESDVGIKENDSSNSPPLRSKVYQAVGKGFWTFIDMASGRYLWRNIVAVDSSSSSSSSASRSKKLD